MPQALQGRDLMNAIDELNRQRKAHPPPAPAPDFQSGDLSDLVAASKRVKTLPARSNVSAIGHLIRARIRRRLQG